MNYHRFRFGIWKNIKVLVCRIFGRRINENPENHWCDRCNLSYEECYYPLDWWVESGIVDVEELDNNELKSALKDAGWNIKD